MLSARWGVGSAARGTVALGVLPSAQRAMSERAGSTVTEVPASHSVYVSQPAAVAALITQAATATRE